jgi:hypothetical protein
MGALKFSLCDLPSPHEARAFIGAAMTISINLRQADHSSFCVLAQSSWRKMQREARSRNSARAEPIALECCQR